MSERSGDPPRHLTPEDRRLQNWRAFSYLKSLLGQEGSRIVSQIPTIEIKLMPGGNSVEVIYQSPDWWKNPIHKETYWISDEGLVSCRFEQRSRLISGLTYRKKEDIEVRSGREADLLPGGAESQVTTAKFIANDIRLRVEGRAR